MLFVAGVTTFVDGFYIRVAVLFVVSWIVRSIYSTNNLITLPTLISLIPIIASGLDASDSFFDL